MRPPKSHIQEIIEAEVNRLTRNGAAKRPKQRIALTDQRAMLSIDPGDVLSDRVVVYDDREPRTR
jgi:hypothetical protein